MKIMETSAIKIIRMHLTSIRMRVIDYAVNELAADKLVRQYQLAYGDAFIVYQE